MSDLDVGMVAPCIPNDGRSIIATAFELLDHVGALEPARLIDLAEAIGIPHPTVHRLLKQLIAVGAVRREGTRYRLGASLLGLGSRVTPSIGSASSLGDPWLSSPPPPAPVSACLPGSAVRWRSSTRWSLASRWSSPCLNRGARYRRERRRTALTSISSAHRRLWTPVLWCRDLSCVTVTIALSGGQVAAVTALVAAKRPPVALLAATRATGARIAARLRAPSPRVAPTHANVHSANNGSPVTASLSSVGEHDRNK